MGFRLRSDARNLIPVAPQSGEIPKLDRLVLPLCDLDIVVSASVEDDQLGGVLRRNGHVVVELYGRKRTFALVSTRCARMIHQALPLWRRLAL